MQPKYLRNRKTGVVFPFHKGLVKNKDMEPYDEALGDIAEEAVIDPSSEAFDISKAKKPELLAFAANEFGVQLEDSLTVKELRAQIKTLSEEA